MCRCSAFFEQISDKNPTNVVPFAYLTNLTV